MHKDLAEAFNKLVEIIKTDERCKGGWHYGSVSRNQTDIYSDYDPVFLVADKDFEQFAADVPRIFKQISDELLICWPENYNSNILRITAIYLVLEIIYINTFLKMLMYYNFNKLLF